jgi:hypothetical protein
LKGLQGGDIPARELARAKMLPLDAMPDNLKGLATMKQKNRLAKSLRIQDCAYELWQLGVIVSPWLKSSCS